MERESYHKTLKYRGCAESFVLVSGETLGFSTWTNGFLSSRRGFFVGGPWLSRSACVADDGELEDGCDDFLNKGGLNGLKTIAGEVSFRCSGGIETGCMLGIV